MSNVKTINSEDVFAGMYELLKAKPWLTKVEPILKHNSHQFVTDFLREVRDGESNDWGGTPVKLKGAVYGVIMDFMLTLQHPESVFNSVTWQVDITYLPWQAALDVLVQEIKLSDPR